MTIIQPSTQKFIDNPDNYFIKATFKDKTCTFSAEEKNLINRIKAFLSSYFDNYFGVYKLERVCLAAEWLDPVPENTPFKQALNKLIGKHNAKLDPKIFGVCILLFDARKVTLRDEVVLTREKIKELANEVFKDGYLERVPILNSETQRYDLQEKDIKDRIVALIDKHMEEGLEKNPELYMNHWLRKRGGTHDFRVPEDVVKNFFLKHVFNIYPI